MNFDQAFTTLLGHEGGYSNHPSDPGGETMWGITKRAAVANGYFGNMRDLSQETAKGIYRKLYWDAVRADELPEEIRYPVFDAAVNSGVGSAVRWLQREVGVAEDGKIGPVTIAATKALDPNALKAKIIGTRLKFMTDLTTWGTFGKGWARRIATLLRM